MSYGARKELQAVASQLWRVPDKPKLKLKLKLNVCLLKDSQQ
jgi:hypothetical protein